MDICIKNKIVVPNTKIIKAPLKQAIGLMFSKQKNIIFEFKKEKKELIHMFFVFYPIDLIFLNKSKKVVELKGEKSIGDFQSFDQVDLNFHDLKMMIQFPDTNLTWLKTLSSVNGIYLIKDKVSGKLYVGSAYGAQGIYGRWSVYAKNGHGGNIELQGLDPTNFQFSILEIVPATTTADGVIDCENRWKEKLGTRQFGLNKN